MNGLKTIGLLFFLSLCLGAFAQDEIKHEQDSTYIFEVEAKDPPKVLHAEPLYIDLIRDLGARKGEREWNFGLGLTDNLSFDTYEALVEYEWAPINRLGLEIEVPFTLYAPSSEIPRDSIPSNRMEGIKTAIQWSFFVNEDIATSMAFGYINELVFSDLNDFGNPLFTGNLFNPFFVIAKRWGSNFHTLIYTGPQFELNFDDQSWHNLYEMHTNLHYMVPGTRNFIGVEFNKYFQPNDFDMTIRPQMRLEITHEVMIGIVVGIPVSREDERFSTFLRLIWEPS